eukprot:4838520-Amphidinium_carterae.1
MERVPSPSWSRTGTPGAFLSLVLSELQAGCPAGWLPEWLQPFGIQARLRRVPRLLQGSR